MVGQKVVSVTKLMSALRDVMAKEMSANRRLNAVLTLLCEQLHMPTAVLYILRPGDVLERHTLVGRPYNLATFVRLGEDVIGQSALSRKASLSASSTHKTVLTVPLIRGNELVGVLALFSKKKEILENEIVEAVQNVAMVLAEFLTDLTTNNATNNLGTVSTSKILEGTSMVRGFALGEVLLHRRVEISGAILATNPEREIKKLNTGCLRIEKTIQKRLARVSIPPEEKELFETYLMFLNDVAWKEKIESAIKTGLSAQAAVQKIGEDVLQKMRSISDPYLRERARDFQDLTSKLIQALMGKRAKKKLIGHKILVADTLGAAELLDYDLKHIKGIILEDGSKTTHVVIVARAYRIPLIGAIKGATRQLEDAAPVAMDGVKGKVYLRPSDEILDMLKSRQKILRQIELLQAKNRDKLPQTKDGVQASLMLNMGLTIGTDKLPVCDGIGLYRTELLFMMAKSLPDVHSQTEAYRRVIVQAKNKPVVFRTLDIGSDKVLPYFEKQGEENPAMGWRSIRMTLDRRALLRMQIRTLLRATAGHTLRIMFPMITTIAEYLEARHTLNLELKDAVSHHEKTPKEIIVGTMLEVPALIFQLDNLLPLVDFVSIGTNDLAQFMFAADRSNTQITNRYDVLCPAFLKTIKYIVEQCDKYKVHCSVCGEMASRPIEAITLMALGVRTLSMSPEAVEAVKTTIRSIHLDQYRAYLLSQLNSRQPSLREALSSYLRDHHVQLGEIR